MATNRSDLMLEQAYRRIADIADPDTLAGKRLQLKDAIESGDGNLFLGDVVWTVNLTDIDARLRGRSESMARALVDLLTVLDQVKLRHGEDTAVEIGFEEGDPAPE